ncbi:MAG TPA: hypothetical protein VE974_23720 [Thermoanaerobaculia bacterium]|nr:hypothetical protein [Thermoanaerobaculia bacterium]
MTERKRQIEELEAELRSRGASFHIGDDFDEEMRESFLRHVLSFEDEPETTIALSSRRMVTMRPTISGR